ncbi:MAG: hypothetical protein GY835_13520 [bacterium]|nr:hypothetical protein [bacterium]
MWNCFNLDEIDLLFDDDDSLTYFASGRQGVLTGLDEVRHHHERCGFVHGGKRYCSRIRLEERTKTELKGMAVVSALWFMKEGTGKTYRGPVTFVCKWSGSEWRFVHLNFGSYV